MTGKKTKAGALRWLRPDYRVPRLARPGETARQIEAALIAPDAKSSKPSYPAGDNVAPTAAVLAALARMGHLALPDRGRSFTLRRTAQENAA